jgi:molecular chaperone DnaK
MSADNRTLGRFQLTDIPPSPRGIPQVEVTFDIDANGIIDVKATDKGTGKVQNIKIESGSSLTDEEIQKMRDEAESNAEEDRKKKEEIDKLNEADAMVFQTEKQINEFGDKLSDEDKSTLEGLTSELKEACKVKDLDKIDSVMEKLNDTWQSTSQKMYEDTESKKDPSEDVIDVEHEEV